MTNTRRATSKRDTLLAHCIARAVIHDQGGIDAAVERYGPRAERLSKWGALKAAARVTPKASRVAAFIVMWAVAMRDEAVEELTISHYQRYWNLSERQAYREQSEFRDLWPELETPNEFGRQLVDALDAKLSKRQIATLPNSLMVNAEQPA
jgi:hypothetical protein